MTQYNAPTKIGAVSKISASGFFTPTGSLPPVWQTLPATFNQQQGTSIDFSTLCSSPQGYTLLFSVSVNSTLTAAQLAAAGVTLASNGLMTIASNASLTTLNNIKLNADDQHGHNTDSAFFAISITSASLAWTVYRNYTLSNTDPPSGPSQLVAGTSPQIFGPFSTFAQAYAAATIDSATTPDIVVVQPGNYPNDDIGVAKNLKVVCLDPVNYATVKTYGDANMTPLSKSVWLENLRFAGHKTVNCAGAGGSGDTCHPISVTNANVLHIHRCMLEENALGVLTGGYTGAVSITDTEFKDCGGTGNPAVHSIYAVVGVTGSWPNISPLNPNASLTVIGCKFWFQNDWCTYLSSELWRVGIAHYLKSDMIATKVYGCFFKTTTPQGGGSTTCKIQGDLGGYWDIRGNQIEEGQYSGADPTSGAFTPTCPPTTVGYHTNDTKIVNIAAGDIALGAPVNNWWAWTAAQVQACTGGSLPGITISQNTYINNGRSSERVLLQTYNFGNATPYDSSYWSGGVNIKDNYIMRGMGLADVDANPSWIQDGSNTVVQDSTSFVNAATDNYQPVTPVSGSGAFPAPYEYQETNGRPGHKARTDTNRGAVSPLSIPDYVAAAPVNAWIDIPNSNFRAAMASTYPTGAPTPPGFSNPYQPLPDFEPGASVGSSTSGIPGEIYSDSGCWHSPALGILGIGPSGGHTKTWCNGSYYIAYRRNAAAIVGWKVWKTATKWKYINYQNSSTDPSAPTPGWPNGLYGQYAYNDGTQIAGQINRPQFVDALGCVVASVGTNPVGGGGGFTWKLGPFVGSDPDYLTNPPSYAQMPKFDGDPNSWTDFMWSEGASVCTDQATGTIYVIVSNSAPYGGVTYSGIYKWVPSNTVKVAPVKIGNLSGTIGSTSAGWVGMCFDSKRNLLVCAGNVDPAHPYGRPFTALFVDLSQAPNCVLRAYTMTGDVGAQNSGPVGSSGILDSKYTPGLEYVPDLGGGAGDFYAFYDKFQPQRYYKIVPPAGAYNVTTWTTTPWQVTAVTPSTATGTVPAATIGTCGGKFRFDPVIKCLLVMGDGWGGFGVPSPDMFPRLIKLA